jgi:hypothetical protein
VRVVVQWLPETGTVFVVVVFEGDWRLSDETAATGFRILPNETLLGSAELPR